MPSVASEVRQTLSVPSLRSSARSQPELDAPEPNSSFSVLLDSAAAAGSPPSPPPAKTGRPEPADSANPAKPDSSTDPASSTPNVAAANTKNAGGGTNGNTAESKKADAKLDDGGNAIGVKPETKDQSDKDTSAANPTGSDAKTADAGIPVDQAKAAAEQAVTPNTAPIETAAPVAISPPIVPLAIAPPAVTAANAATSEAPAAQFAAEAVSVAGLQNIARPAPSNVGQADDKSGGGKVPTGSDGGASTKAVSTGGSAELSAPADQQATSPKTDFEGAAAPTPAGNQAAPAAVPRLAAELLRKPDPSQPASRSDADAAGALKAGADAIQSLGIISPSGAANAATNTPGVMPASAPGQGQTTAIPLAGLAIEIATQASAGKHYFEIRLDPPELGRIDVRLDVDRDGNVTTRLIADRSDTLNLLQRDSSQLARALQDAGLKTSDNGLQFSLRQQSFAQGDGAGQRTPATAVHAIIPVDDPAPTDALRQTYGRLLGIGSGLDIRV